MEHTFINWRTSFAYSIRLIAIVFLAGLAGCVQQTPVAYYAHPGGTIILGLGGIQRNVKGTTNLQASDLAITITADGTNFTTLTPIQIFKSFPDYSSTLTQVGLNGNAAGVLPFDGGWFVSVTVPPSLAPGSYTISITSPTDRLTNTNVNSALEGNLTAIPLQVEAIPSGLDSFYSSLNQVYKGQFTYYSTQAGRLDVSPSPALTGGSTVYGGLQLVITFPAANYASAVAGSPPIVALPYSHNPSIQLAQNIIDNSDGTKSLVVLLSSSQGFAGGPGRTATLMPRLSDLSLSFLFFIASGSGITSNATQQLADFQIDQSRSHYYDASGNVVASLQPVMTYH